LNKAPFSKRSFTVEKAWSFTSWLMAPVIRLKPSPDSCQSLLLVHHFVGHVHRTRCYMCPSFHSFSSNNYLVHLTTRAYLLLLQTRRRRICCIQEIWDFVNSFTEMFFEGTLLKTWPVREILALSSKTDFCKNYTSRCGSDWVDVFAAYLRDSSLIAHQSASPWPRSRFSIGFGLILYHICVAAIHSKPWQRVLLPVSY
jgi:hypothetical protein